MRDDVGNFTSEETLMPRLPKYPDLGSVSSGTMLTDDLLSAFAPLCKEYGGRKGQKLAREADNLPSSDDRTPEQVEEADGILEDMFDLLQEVAPPRCTFGAHEGDGADFGFWPLLDSLEEDAQTGDVLKVGDTSEVPAGYVGEVMQVSDHGNVTLYWHNRRGFRELWSVV